MAKIKISSIAFLFIFISFCAFSQSNNVRENVKQTYLSQVGVREATGHNDGYAVEMYLKSTGLGKGYAWCAAFVNWTLLQNGIQTVSSPAWAPSWFTKNVIYCPAKNIYLETPETSDIFGIWFKNKSPPRVAHVGFVYKWGNGNFVITVEGNTNEAGSREGDGVYMKRRIKRQIYIISDYIKP